MEKLSGIRRVIWSIDPFDFSPDSAKSSADILNCLSSKGELQILPVYVLCPSRLNFSMEFSPIWTEQYRPAAEKALEAAVRGSGIGATEPPRVLVRDVASNSQVAKALSDYCVEQQADLVLVSTHARHGVKRFFLGSFAETLMTHSEVPVLIANPSVHGCKFGSILMPTEFGAYSKRLFKHVVRLASHLNARLVLFHAIPDPVEPVFQSGVYLLGGSWVPVHAYFSREIERRRHHAEGWRKWAEHQGIPTKVHVEAHGGSIAELIVKIAETHRAQLIAMETQAGPVTASLLGSVTRQVVRSARCPVLVLRPESIESERELPGDAA